jgi:hypothetical protein
MYSAEALLVPVVQVLVWAWNKSAMSENGISIQWAILFNPKFLLDF